MGPAKGTRASLSTQLRYTLPSSPSKPCRAPGFSCLKTLQKMFWAHAHCMRKEWTEPSPTTQLLAVDIVMKFCPRLLREPTGASGRLQRVKTILGASILAGCWASQENTYIDLQTTPPRCSWQVCCLSLLRLWLITKRIQLSPPSWRRWIFSCCLWPTLMDMCTHKPKWVILNGQGLDWTLELVGFHILLVPLEMVSTSEYIRLSLRVFLF